MFVFCHGPIKNFSDHLFHAFLLFILSSFFTTNFFDQTKYKEIPIKTNKIAHTGPKIQLGGLKPGFIKPLYQPLIAEVVKTEPTAPANSQIIMLARSFNRLLNFIFNYLQSCGHSCGVSGQMQFKLSLQVGSDFWQMPSPHLSTQIVKLPLPFVP